MKFMQAFPCVENAKDIQKKLEMTRGEEVKDQIISEKIDEKKPSNPADNIASFEDLGETE